MLDDDALSRGLAASPTPTDGGRSLTGRDWFYTHVVLFLIGSFNLVAINAARTPHQWWSWMPIAAWAVVLACHRLWLAASGRIRPAHSDATPKASS